MSKKPRKVEEQKSSYAEPAAKKGARGSNPDGIEFASPDKVRESNEKLIRIHRSVLEKLAR